MRAISVVLWALFGWPVAVARAQAARRRLRQRRVELGAFTVERVA